MKSIKQSCKGLTSDGSPCEAAAMRESDFCFFHDPSKAAERHEAHAAGGRQNRMKTLEAGASDVEVSDSSKLLELLSQTINQVRKGTIDPRVANSVGYLAGITAKVLNQNELEDRIAKLEELIQRRSKVSELKLTGS
jgi:hypothetical protein